MVCNPRTHRMQAGWGRSDARGRSALSSNAGGQQVSQLPDLHSTHSPQVCSTSFSKRGFSGCHPPHFWPRMHLTAEWKWVSISTYSPLLKRSADRAGFLLILRWAARPPHCANGPKWARKINREPFPRSNIQHDMIPLWIAKTLAPQLMAEMCSGDFGMLVP